MIIVRLDIKIGELKDLFIYHLTVVLKEPAI